MPELHVDHSALTAIASDLSELEDAVGAAHRSLQRAPRPPASGSLLNPAAEAVRDMYSQLIADYSPPTGPGWAAFRSLKDEINRLNEYFANTDLEVARDFDAHAVPALPDLVSVSTTHLPGSTSTELAAPLGSENFEFATLADTWYAIEQDIDNVVSLGILVDGITNVVPFLASPQFGPQTEELEADWALLGASIVAIGSLCGDAGFWNGMGLATRATATRIRGHWTGRTADQASDWFYRLNEAILAHDNAIRLTLRQVESEAVMIRQQVELQIDVIDTLMPSVLSLDPTRIGQLIQAIGALIILIYDALELLVLWIMDLFNGLAAQPAVDFPVVPGWGVPVAP